MRFVVLYVNNFEDNKNDAPAVNWRIAIGGRTKEAQNLDLFLRIWRVYINNFAAVNSGRASLTDWTEKIIIRILRKFDGFDGQTHAARERLISAAF